MLCVKAKQYIEWVHPRHRPSYCWALTQTIKHVTDKLLRLWVKLQHETIGSYLHVYRFQIMLLVAKTRKSLGPRSRAALLPSIFEKWLHSRNIRYYNDYWLNDRMYAEHLSQSTHTFGRRTFWTHVANLSASTNEQAVNIPVDIYWD